MSCLSTIVGPEAAASLLSRVKSPLVGVNSNAVALPSEPSRI